MRLSELKAQVDWVLNKYGDIEVFGVPYHSDYKAYAIEGGDDPVFHLSLQKDGSVDPWSDKEAALFTPDEEGYEALQEYPDRQGDIVAVLGGQTY